MNTKMIIAGRNTCSFYYRLKYVSKYLQYFLQTLRMKNIIKKLQFLKTTFLKLDIIKLDIISFKNFKVNHRTSEIDEIKIK